MSSEPKNNDSPEHGQRVLEVGMEQTLAQFERLAADATPPFYRFRLYVSGTAIRSRRAIASVRALCDQYFAERHQLEVIDVHQQPEEAKAAEIVAIPTLIKELPLPSQRFVGDVSDTARLLKDLNPNP